MNYLLPKYFEKGNFQSVSKYLGIPLEDPDTSVFGQQHPTINLIPDISVTRLKPLTSNLKHGFQHLTPCSMELVPVSIVIPCFNESASLPYLEKALHELKIEARKDYYLKFIFVDDGSNDDTVTELLNLFDDRKDCKIIQQKRNYGVASALRAGLKAAKTEIVCTIDADCSYDPLELLKMIPLLDKGVDMVTASPYHKEGFVVGVPRWRLFLSNSLSKIYLIILKNKLSTYTSCFRVYRRSSIIDINQKYGDFRGIVEILAIADIQGRTIIEYPTTLQCRIFGHSKMKVVKTIIGHIKLFEEIIKYRRNFHLHR